MIGATEPALFDGPGLVVLNDLLVDRFPAVADRVPDFLEALEAVEPAMRPTQAVNLLRRYFRISLADATDLLDELTVRAQLATDRKALDLLVRRRLVSRDSANAAVSAIVTAANSGETLPTLIDVLTQLGAVTAESAETIQTIIRAIHDGKTSHSMVALPGLTVSPPMTRPSSSGAHLRPPLKPSVRAQEVLVEPASADVVPSVGGPDGPPSDVEIAECEPGTIEVGLNDVDIGEPGAPAFRDGLPADDDDQRSSAVDLGASDVDLPIAPGVADSSDPSQRVANLGARTSDVTIGASPGAAADRYGYNADYANDAGDERDAVPVDDADVDVGTGPYAGAGTATGEIPPGNGEYVETQPAQYGIDDVEDVYADDASTQLTESSEREAFAHDRRGANTYDEHAYDEQAYDEHAYDEHAYGQEGYGAQPDGAHSDSEYPAADNYAEAAADVFGDAPSAADDYAQAAAYPAPLEDLALDPVPALGSAPDLSRYVPEYTEAIDQQLVNLAVELGFCSGPDYRRCVAIRRQAPASKRPLFKDLLLSEGILNADSFTSLCEALAFFQQMLRDRDFGLVGVEAGLLNDEDVKRALDLQQYHFYHLRKFTPDNRLPPLLVKLGGTSKSMIIRVLELQEERETAASRVRQQSTAASASHFASASPRSGPFDPNTAPPEFDMVVEFDYRSEVSADAIDTAMNQARGGAAARLAASARAGTLTPDGRPTPGALRDERRESEPEVPQQAARRASEPLTTPTERGARPASSTGFRLDLGSVLGDDLAELMPDGESSAAHVPVSAASFDAPSPRGPAETAPQHADTAALDHALSPMAVPAVGADQSALDIMDPAIPPSDVDIGSGRRPPRLARSDVNVFAPPEDGVAEEAPHPQRRSTTQRAEQPAASTAEPPRPGIPPKERTRSKSDTTKHVPSEPEAPPTRDTPAMVGDLNSNLELVPTSDLGVRPRQPLSPPPPSREERELYGFSEIAPAADLADETPSGAGVSTRASDPTQQPHLPELAESATPPAPAAATGRADVKRVPLDSFLQVPVAHADSIDGSRPPARKSPGRGADAGSIPTTRPEQNLDAPSIRFESLPESTTFPHVESRASAGIPPRAPDRAPKAMPQPRGPAADLPDPERLLEALELPPDSGLGGSATAAKANAAPIGAETRRDRPDVVSTRPNDGVVRVSIESPAAPTREKAGAPVPRAKRERALEAERDDRVVAKKEPPPKEKRPTKAEAGGDKPRRGLPPTPPRLDGNPVDVAEGDENAADEPVDVSDSKVVVADSQNLPATRRPLAAMQEDDPTLNKSWQLGEAGVGHEHSGVKAIPDLRVTAPPKGSTPPPPEPTVGGLRLDPDLIASTVQQAGTSPSGVPAITTASAASGASAAARVHAVDRAALPGSDAAPTVPVAGSAAASKAERLRKRRLALKSLASDHEVREALNGLEKPDSVYLQLLALFGLVRKHQVLAAARECAAMGQFGFGVSMPKLVVTSRLVDADQAKKIEQYRDKAVYVCGACDTFLTRGELQARQASARFVCPACKGKLERAADAAGRSPHESYDPSATGVFLARELEAAPDFFGKYRLIRVIGQNGVATVFEAYDTQRSETIALKTFAEAYRQLAQQQLKKVLVRVAKLIHPHIMPILEIGRVQDEPYYTMPYVQGRNLERVFTAEPLSVTNVLDAVIPVCDAAQYAHEHQILHLDIKPANIVMAGAHTPSAPETYLIDFEMVRFRRASGTNSADRAFGTPAHLAPEQLVIGAELGPFSDVYGLAMTIYEGLTGGLPFQATSPKQLYAQIQNRVPAPASKANPNVTRELDRVLARALDKRPARRFRSAAQLAKALREARP